MLNPTPCKISTITSTGGVNTLVDLEVFFNNVVIEKNDGIIYMEYGKFKKGVSNKVNKKKKESKQFDNQATCIVCLNNMYANVKVFKNGKIQMTGLKSADQGSLVIDCIIENLKNIANSGVKEIVNAIDNIQNIDYKVRLINSDFRIGIDIRRDKLNTLIQRTYDVLSSFEPCIYPGVKIQYFWNKCNVPDGICSCTEECNGKGSGEGNGNCKKITIAVFQSGCIIITGAQSIEQINTAYVFICNVIKNHIDELEKVPIKKITSCFS